MVFPVFESANFHFAVLDLIGKKTNMINIMVFWKKMPPTGSGPIAVGMILLEEVCHCVGRLQGLIYAQSMPSKIDQFLLPMS